MSSPGPSYNEQQAREAIAASRSYTEALRRLDMCPSGGNWRTLKHYATNEWDISVAHFDPRAARRDALARYQLTAKRPLHEILVENSIRKWVRAYEREADERRAA